MMLMIKVDDGSEIQIAECSHVLLDGNKHHPGGMYANWHEVPRETQGRILELRDSLRATTQALVDLMTAELGEFIENPSDWIPCPSMRV
jgi:hypothetical protein